MQPVQHASERAVFGTAYREQEERRFVSNLHNAGVPNLDTPGPGAYRTAENRLMKTDKASKFGTSAQRPDIPREALSKPGPVYDLPSTLSLQSASFGSPSSMLRAARSARSGSPLRDPRSLMSERFPLENMDIPGPNSYPLIPTTHLSQHASAPHLTFGRASREAAARGNLTAAQLAADPTVTTAAETPGAAYELRSSLASAGTVFTKGAAHYAPERGGNAKGPYIGRLHDDAFKGIESPGPGSYPTGTTLQGSGGAKFGPPSPTRTPKPNEVDVPGPGAHNPNFGAASVRPTSSAFSMGANLRTDFTAFSPNTPGPAAYTLPGTDRVSTAPASPAFSMGLVAGGRTSYMGPRNANPAPDAYGRPDDPRDRSPTKKGFSFGLRERTRSAGTVITNRYHGPLAAAEAMGLESPGPGCYELPNSIAAARSGSPATRFGTSGRDAASKIYISHMHASAEGYGLASPGPGCYNVADAGGVGSATRFSTKVAPKFGTSARFNDKVCTK
ncbi:hypothetical protein HYH03_016162 [Edaphochlamys debaryana]|uniref:Uncharacterized protein n=1 Tax=Edaphochlamys debaryana TaxID=47281 RepID=A0A836BQE8_9CHLO|nr:hypothetical protein HYH03_016162 [Edaphochlamys debaryana]|eukprot:KAG2485065.1 hypothetical protein HYH03_016162 [Edaphochlamys debaryana]